MDRLTPDRRSWNMSRIRSRDTVPEVRVRSVLHRLGFRFSLRRKDLPGKPDIVLPARRAVVFVHGCFWHQHDGCMNATMPSTRRSFWKEKLLGNVARDRRVEAELRSRGWKVLTVWECELANEDSVAQRCRRMLSSDGRGGRVR
jgi:DNA mismatch endonuclease (patch repair protein)